MLPDTNGDLAEMNGQSRGVLHGARRRRGRRPAAGGKVSGRKFQIPDSVFERLLQTAIKKRTNPSAVVSEILNRELRYFEVIERDGLTE